MIYLWHNFSFPSIFVALFKVRFFNRSSSIWSWLQTPLWIRRPSGSLPSVSIKSKDLLSLPTFISSKHSYSTGSSIKVKDRNFKILVEFRSWELPPHTSKVLNVCILCGSHWWRCFSAQRRGWSDYIHHTNEITTICNNEECKLPPKCPF